MNWGFWIPWGLAVGGFLFGMVGLLNRAKRLRAFFVWQSEVIGELQRKTGRAPEQFESTRNVLRRPIAEWKILVPGFVSLFVLFIALGKLLFIELGW